MEMDQKLSVDNYQKGFLIDEQFLAGVSTSSNTYSAYIIAIQTGEYVEIKTFETAQLAVDYLNFLPRNWSFEEEACGNGSCNTCRSGESPPHCGRESCCAL